MKITQRTYQLVDVQINLDDAEVLAEMAEQAAGSSHERAFEFERLAMLFRLLHDQLWIEGDQRAAD